MCAESLKETIFPLEQAHSLMQFTFHASNPVIVLGWKEYWEHFRLRFRKGLKICLRLHVFVCVLLSAIPGAELSRVDSLFVVAVYIRGSSDSMASCKLLI